MIFTFDGDEAGQKAALRAFEGDQQFVGQTYVAVEPGGHDPCELRISDGDAAVRELIAPQGPAVPVRPQERHLPLRPGPGRQPGRRGPWGGAAGGEHPGKVEGRRFARELAGMVGVDVETVRVEVRWAAGRGRERPSSSAAGSARGDERRISGSGADRGLSVVGNAHPRRVARSPGPTCWPRGSTLTIRPFTRWRLGRCRPRRLSSWTCDSLRFSSRRFPVTTSTHQS